MSITPRPHRATSSTAHLSSRGPRRAVLRRSRTLLVVLLLAVTACTSAAHRGPENDGPTLSAAATPEVPPLATSYSLDWADEFEGPAGSPADPARWTHDVGGDGWGNQQLDYDTEGTRNVALDGQGNLVITATREGASTYDCWYGPCRYTSGRIKTAGKATARYGRIEARMRVPAGRGFWPAFWMLGEDLPARGWPAAGEIDIMENVGHEPGTVHGSLHGPGYSGGESLTGSYVLPAGARLADDFHTYAVEWAPGVAIFSVDGVRYFTATSNDAAAWAHDAGPAFLILNLAVGGTWPGEPPADTAPARLVVDRVAVYQAMAPEPRHRAAAGVEAESAATQQGATVLEGSLGAHGTAVGGLAEGDWLGFGDLDLGSGGDSTMRLRYASGGQVSGRVEVRLGTLAGPPLGTIEVLPTGGWSTWTTGTTHLTLPPGAHDVYLSFTSASPAEFVDIDDFTIERS